MGEGDEKREPKDRVILALDVSTAEAALRLVEETRGLVGMYKVGSQLFTAVGPDLVRALLRQGERVFLDLKFHDIPTTVARAGIEAARLGVSMFTIHALGGEPMMQAVVEAVADFCAREAVAPPRILAVTVLTSLGAEDLAKVGLRARPEEVAVALARLAHTCGVGGGRRFRVGDRADSRSRSPSGIRDRRPRDSSRGRFHAGSTTLGDTAGGPASRSRLPRARPPGLRERSSARGLGGDSSGDRAISGGPSARDAPHSEVFLLGRKRGDLTGTHFGHAGRSVNTDPSETFRLQEFPRERGTDVRSLAYGEVIW